MVGPVLVTRCTGFDDTVKDLTKTKIAHSLSRRIFNKITPHRGVAKIGCMMMLDPNYYLLSGKERYQFDWHFGCAPYVAIWDTPEKLKKAEHTKLQRLQKFTSSVNGQLIDPMNIWVEQHIVRYNDGTQRVVVEYGPKVYTGVYHGIGEFMKTRRFNEFCNLEGVNWAIWNGYQEDVKLREHLSLKSQIKSLKEQNDVLKQENVALKQEQVKYESLKKENDKLKQENVKHESLKKETDESKQENNESKQKNNESKQKNNESKQENNESKQKNNESKPENNESKQEKSKPENNESIEENNKSIEENNESIEENNKSKQKNNASTEKNNVSTEKNKSIEQNNKSIEENNKSIEENNKSIEFL